MRKELIPYAEKAAAESYGRDHRFWYLYGRKLRVPGLIAVGVLGTYMWGTAAGWVSVLGYLAVVGLVGIALVFVVHLVTSGTGRSRLPDASEPLRPLHSVEDEEDVA